MSETNLNKHDWDTGESKPKIQSIDVASQSAKIWVEWVLELLRDWNNISPEMKKILKKQATELLAVLNMKEEIGENIPLSEAELSENQSIYRK